MVNVLVTGGAGFIGSNFVRYALAAHPDWQVTTLDKLTYAGRLENLESVMDDPRHRFVKGDVADAAVAAPLVKAADIVVHFAAETHVDRSIMSAGEFITTDVYGTFVLLEAARESAGAAALRADLDRRGLRQRAGGIEPRDRRAAAAESRTRRARRAPTGWPTATGRPTTCRSIITRASNNYGPNQFPEKVIPLFITNLIDDIPVPLYGDGLNERDWLHVDDHCRGVDLLIDQGDAGRGLQHRRRQRGEERRPDAPDPRAASASPTSLIRPVADRPGHDRRYSLDTSKLRVARLAAAARLRAGPRRDRRVVPAERVVVAADQGPGSGVPRVLPRPSTANVAPDACRGWLPLCHRRDRLRGRPLSNGSLAGRAAGRTPGRTAAAAQPTLDGDAARHAGPRSICSIARRCATRCRRPRVPRSSITAPASPTSQDAWRRPARALRVNVLGTHHLLEGVRDAGLTCRVLVTGSALVYRPRREPIARRRSDRPGESVRREQAGAGDDSRPAPPRRRRCWSGRSTTPARGSRRRMSRRRSRGRSPRSRPGAASRCSASATSTRGATSPTSATPSAPTRRSCEPDSRAARTTSAAAGRTACGDLLDILLSLARVTVASRWTRRACGRATIPSSLGSHARASPPRRAGRRRSPSSRRSTICWTTGAAPGRMTAIDPDAAGEQGRASPKTARQLVHIAMGGVRAPAALAAAGGRRSCWPAAALAFNLFVLPRIAGERCIARPIGERGVHGHQLYPARRAAAAPRASRGGPTSSPRRGASSRSATAWRRWPGAHIGGPRWPWNREKTLSGSAAFVLGGGAAGVVPGLVVPAGDRSRRRTRGFSIWRADRRGDRRGRWSKRSRSGSTTTSPSRPPRARCCGWRRWRQLGRSAGRRGRWPPRALPAALALNALVAWAGYRARHGDGAGRRRRRDHRHHDLRWPPGGRDGCCCSSRSSLAVGGVAAGPASARLLLGIAEERGGRRGAGNAIANTGVAAIAAVLSR